MEPKKTTLITPEKKTELINDFVNIALKGLEVMLRGLADMCKGQEKKEDIKNEDWLPKWFYFGNSW